MKEFVRYVSLLLVIGIAVPRHAWSATPNASHPSQAVLGSISSHLNDESDHVSHVVVRNDLVDVTAPSEKMKLAEPNRLRLVVRAQGLTNVAVEQIQHPMGSTLGFSFPGDTSTVPVQYQPDGGATIQIVPLRLGKLELRIIGRFQDGSVFAKSVNLEVELPTRKPQRLIAAPGEDARGVTRITLEMHGQPNQVWVVVDAVYEGVRNPIPIDSHDVSYRVRSNDDVPAVEVDHDTGRLTPVHLGHALVESSFDGLKTLTCVVVHDKFGVPTYTDDHSNCGELLNPGEELTRP